MVVRRCDTARIIAGHSAGNRTGGTLARDGRGTSVFCRGRTNNCNNCTNPRQSHTSVIRIHAIKQILCVVLQ